MDILKVGTSLGAGGIACLYRDSMYRVGDKGTGSYRVLFEGPLRSRFELVYRDWKVDGENLEVIHRIEIVGGRHYYQSHVIYSGSEADLPLVAGMVNMKSEELYVLEPDPHHVGFVTLDAQAENSCTLAMALLVPREYLLGHGKTPDRGEGITQTYYAMLDAAPGSPVPYRFYSLWEKEDPRWASLEEVEAFLKEEAARWTQSVIVQVRQ
jgi:hypothetical protein